MCFHVISTWSPVCVTSGRQEQRGDPSTGHNWSKFDVKNYLTVLTKQKTREGW